MVRFMIADTASPSFALSASIALSRDKPARVMTSSTSLEHSPNLSVAPARMGARPKLQALGVDVGLRGVGAGLLVLDHVRLRPGEVRVMRRARQQVLRLGLHRVGVLCVVLLVRIREQALQAPEKKIARHGRRRRTDRAMRARESGSGRGPNRGSRLFRPRHLWFGPRQNLTSK